MPQATMRGVTVYGFKIQAEPHTTPQIRGTVCDGCAMMSCISQRSRREPWRYWCERRRKRVEPWEVECADRPADEVPEERFCDRLRRAMEELGYTRAQVAEATGVRPATVASWEHGRGEPMEPRASVLAEMMGW